MKEDLVDELLQQWAAEHPNKNVSALGVIVRIQMLGKLLQRQTTSALAKHGLKHWEYDALSILRRQGKPFEMTASDIAEAALLTSGAMTTRIDGLVSRGFVRRCRSKTDGRSIPVRLTAKGKRTVDLAIDTRMEDANLALKKIGERDKERLATQLRRLLIDINQ